MRESRTYGFVRGVPGDWHPYRDRRKQLCKLSAPVVNCGRICSAGRVHDAAQSLQQCHTEAACREYLARLRWPDEADVCDTVPAQREEAREDSSTPRSCWPRVL